MATSPALQKLSERLGEVEALLALCSAPDAALKDRTAAAMKDGALLRGGLVLLCSHVEGYFEDLITDALSAYERFAGIVGHVPTEIRARQVIGKPDRWDTPDPLKRWEVLQHCFGHALINSAVAVRERAIDASLHTQGFANPGTGEIDTLFKTVGIVDIWDRFAKLEADRLVKESVDAIVHRRNQIAHGDMESTVTRADVEVYLGRTKRLAEVMDSIVGAELAARVDRQDIWTLIDQA